MTTQSVLVLMTLWALSAVATQRTVPEMVADANGRPVQQMTLIDAFPISLEALALRADAAVVGKVYQGTISRLTG